MCRNKLGALILNKEGNRKLGDSGIKGTFTFYSICFCTDHIFAKKMLMYLSTAYIVKQNFLKQEKFVLDYNIEP